MSQSTPSGPGPDASQAEIEADIAETRARLADSVDALADKMDVKARAQEKVDDVKSTAQAKVADVRMTAQAKAVEGREKVVQASREVSTQVQALPRPAQIALAAAPVLLAVLLVVRKVRA